MQLSKRFERREEAKEGEEEAKETGACFTCLYQHRNLLLRSLGTTEDVDRFSRRQVRVTREQNEECRKLLGLMGIPYVVVRRVLLPVPVPHAHYVFHRHPQKPKLNVPSLLAEER